MASDNKPNDLCYILNENNKYITKKYIEDTLKRYDINIKIKNLELFQQAMIHLSYLIRDEKFYANNKTKPYQIQSNDIEPLDDISKAIPLQEQSYERLEFLGDAILHAILAEYIFNRYEQENEGFMTKLRTKIENGDTLTILSNTIGLNEYIIISRYVEKNGGRETNKKILEDAFEAFMGALYHEAGYNVCKKFIVTLIEKEIDFAKLLYQETNFKEKLLQYFHLRKWMDPIYGTLDISGPENKKMYTMYVKCRKNAQDEGELVGIGIANSKKAGEQEACKKAMIHYGLYNDSDDSDFETDMFDVLTDSDRSEISNNDSDFESDYESDSSSDSVEIIKGKNNKICQYCNKRFTNESQYKKHVASLCKKKSLSKNS